MYVQDELRNTSDQVWDALESGAHFYVCGDALSMAGAVEDALLDIISQNQVILVFTASTQALKILLHKGSILIPKHAMQSVWSTSNVRHLLCKIDRAARLHCCAGSRQASGQILSRKIESGREISTGCVVLKWLEIFTVES